MTKNFEYYNRQKLQDLDINSNTLKKITYVSIK